MDIRINIFGKNREQKFPQWTNSGTKLTHFLWQCVFSETKQARTSGWNVLRRKEIEMESTGSYLGGETYGDAILLPWFQHVKKAAKLVQRVFKIVLHFASMSALHGKHCQRLYKATVFGPFPACLHYSHGDSVMRFLNLDFFSSNSFSWFQ